MKRESQCDRILAALRLARPDGGLVTIDYRVFGDPRLVEVLPAKVSEALVQRGDGSSEA